MQMDITYLAGFFDGEGSVALYPNGNGSYAVRVQITQNENPLSVELIEELKSIYGGGITHSFSTNGRPKMNWALSGAKAVVLLRDIQPLSRLKKPQIDLLLSWWDTKLPPARGPRGRMVARTPEELAAAEAVHLRMKEMKRE